MANRTLDAVASVDPDSLTVTHATVLCERLVAHDDETRRRAESVRDDLVDVATDLDRFVAVLCESLARDDYPPPRAVTDTLNRVLSDDTPQHVDHVEALLDGDTPRERGVALAVLDSRGGVEAYVEAYAAALDDGDDRIRALGVRGFSAAPERARNHLTDLRPFLHDEWVPDDGGGMQLTYSKHPTGDPSLGEAPGERLTNEVVRPYEDTLEILGAVAAIAPNEVSAFVPRLRDLLADHRQDKPQALLETLVALARADSSAVEPALPAVRPLAEEGSVLAREILATVGDPLDHPDPVTVPREMSRRNRPKQPGDDDVLAEIDIDLACGDLDPAAVVPLLECEDGTVRDEAWWGLSTAPVEPVLAVLDDHATTLLSLFDEPHDCARKHMPVVLGSLARRSPERWAPALAELATHQDARVAETARAHLDTAYSEAPALVEDALDAAGVDQPEGISD